MKLVKAFLGEPLKLQKRDRHRIAEGHLKHGRGRGRQIVRTGLAHLGKHDRHIGCARQRAACAAGHRDHRHRAALGIAQDVGQLVRLARPGQGQDRIVGMHHAEIPVRGLRGMQEIGRCARGRKRRRQLSRDMTGFPQPGDDQAALHFRYDLKSLRHIAFDVLQHVRQFAKPGHVDVQSGSDGVDTFHARLPFPLTAVLRIVPDLCNATKPDRPGTAVRPYRVCAVLLPRPPRPARNPRACRCPGCRSHPWDRLAYPVRRMARPA